MLFRAAHNGVREIVSARSASTHSSLLGATICFVNQPRQSATGDCFQVLLSDMEWGPRLGRSLVVASNQTRSPAMDCAGSVRMNWIAECGSASRQGASGVPIAPSPVCFVVYRLRVHACFTADPVYPRGCPRSSVGPEQRDSAGDDSPDTPIIGLRTLTQW